MGVILSPVLAAVDRADGYRQAYFVHWCPACDQLHRFNCDEPLPNGARWTRDGPDEFPSFSPSMKITTGSCGEGPPDVCHYFLRGGVLEFCGDCTHRFRGMTVPLPALPPEALVALQAAGASRSEGVGP